MAKIIVVFVVFGLCLLISSNGKKDAKKQLDVSKQLKRIERHFRYLRDDVRSIVDKLDLLESKFTPARVDDSLLGPPDTVDVPDAVNNRKITNEKANNELLDMMQRLMQAFNEEKKINVELKRALGDKMVVNQDYSSVLESFTQQVKDDFRSNIDRFRDNLTKIIDEETCRSEYTSLSSDIKEVKDILINKESVANEYKDRTFSSCLDLLEHGSNDSKVYTIVINNQTLRVYCDQETDGGGWTVFQRRQDGSVDFNRDWDNYKNGFGDLVGEFWLGNEYIAELTRECCHEMRIDIGDFDDSFGYAKYSNFSVGNESTKYILFIGGYTGNTHNSMYYHNGQQFTTADNDNDEYKHNCARYSKGGFWFNSCARTNPNGIYPNSSIMSDTSLYWSLNNLKYIDMKLR